jgi:hypothetical protein
VLVGCQSAGHCRWEVQACPVGQITSCYRIYQWNLCYFFYGDDNTKAQLWGPVSKSSHFFDVDCKKLWNTIVYEL